MITIRKANKNDTVLISHLSVETFYESYAADNTEEDMRLYVSQNFDIYSVNNELENQNTIFFLIAQNDEIVGYTKLGFHKMPLQLSNNKTMEIERFYVLKNHHRNGIGSRLMNHCIEFAKTENKEALWLGVWEQNNKAIMFYEHYGFKKIGSQNFIFGTDIQQDFIMKLML